MYLCACTVFVVCMVLMDVPPASPLEELSDEDMFLYWRRSASSQCEPFTTQTIDCNKCICSADGTSYCTRMACHKPKATIRRVLPDEEFPW